MTEHDSAPAGTANRAAVRNRENAVVARLQALSTALDDEPDPRFRSATRARLVAMAAVRTPSPPPRRPGAGGSPTGRRTGHRRSSGRS